MRCAVDIDTYAGIADWLKLRSVKPVDQRIYVSVEFCKLREVFLDRGAIDHHIVQKPAALLAVNYGELTSVSIVNDALEHGIALGCRQEAVDNLDTGLT